MSFFPFPAGKEAVLYCEAALFLPVDICRRKVRGYRRGHGREAINPRRDSKNPVIMSRDEAKR